MNASSMGRMSPGSGKRVLVTGGLGYVGSWLTRCLALAGHEVFVLSRGKGSSGALPDLGAPYAFIPADLVEETPQALAEKLPGGLDACIHAAAAVDGASPGYARQSLLANGLGTRNLLEALCLRTASGNGAPEERTAGRAGPLPLFLYCSTFHVYGPVSGHISEDTPPAPVNDYALTHLFGEEYCRLFTRAKGMPCIILRPSNGYGAPLLAPFRQWNLLINDLCRSAFDTGRITLRANPDQERDFIRLADVARMAEALISRPDLAGRTFNLSSGQTLSLGAVADLAAKTAAKVLERSVDLELLTPPGTEKAAPLFVDNTAVREALNFAPEYDAAASMQHEMTAILEFLKTHEHP